jgi:hypothetical protein
MVPATASGVSALGKVCGAARENPARRAAKLASMRISGAGSGHHLGESPRLTERHIAPPYIGESAGSRVAECRMKPPRITPSSRAEPAPIPHGLYQEN